MGKVYKCTMENYLPTLKFRGKIINLLVEC